MPFVPGFSIAMRLLNRYARKVGEVTTAADPDPYASWLYHSDAKVRLLVQACTERGGGDPIPGLIETLRGPDLIMAVTAAQALGDIAPNLEDETRRAEIVLALLGKLADYPALEQQSSLSMREAQSSLQPCAAEALGRIADPAAFDGLRAALRDESPAVRRKAAWALMRIGDPRCVPDLAPLLADADADVRGTVFEILKLFNTEEAVAALEAWRARRTAHNP